MAIKDKLKNRELTLGSWLMLGNSSVVEILKYAGLEWLVVDLEHTSIDMDKARELITTIQACGMEALVRVTSNDEVIIKRVLDFGADGVVVPMVCTKEDAENAVAFSKYPPIGKRGVGLFRAQGYGLEFDEYRQKVEDNLVVIAQVEHIDGVSNIDSIISVPGIDGVIIGPYDMSASMGFPGQFHRKDVQDSIGKVFKSCLAQEKSVGYHVIETEPSVALEKVTEGCNLIALSIDYFFLRDKAIESVAEFRRGVEQK